MEYEYKNLKNNKKIKINIDKNYTFIYGPNGTGKTTFSRAIGNGKIIPDNDFNKIHLVFNQDFVNNNIYISTSDGTYKSDTKNKSKLKQIFLGDSSKDDNEKLIFLRQKIREYSKLEFNVNNFKNDFKNIVIELISKDEDYSEDYENYILQYVDDNLLNQYFGNVIKKVKKNDIKIDSLKLDDENYIDKIELGKIDKTYTDDEVKNELLKFYRECYDNKEKSLNKIVDDFNKKFVDDFKIEFINEKIQNINEQLDNLKASKELYEIILKLETEEDEYLRGILDGKRINIKEVKTWITNGDNFHKEIEFNSCLYCKNEISKDLKEKKSTLAKNKYLLYLKEYAKQINELIADLDNLEYEYNNLIEKNVYETVKIEKEEQYFRILIKKKNAFKLKYQKEIEEKKYSYNAIKQLNDFINLLEKATNYLKIKIQEEKKEKTQLFKAYQLYLSSDKFIKEIKNLLIRHQLIIDEKKCKDKIQNDTQDYISKIKDYIKEFEDIYEPRFELVINSSLSRADNAETTIEITSNETNFLNNISEGEKNILALIIFFSYVKNVLSSLKENEQIVLILDDPVNSNDWGNFFKFQAIIEDYFYKDIIEDKKISNVILLSHNIDYAVIQLENDKYEKHFEFIRLFSDKAIKIDTNFIFMDDIKLGSKLIHDLYTSIECVEDNGYIEKHKLYRVAIYMRKFLESFLNRTISIADPNLAPNKNESIKFLKDNIDSTNIDNLLSVSTTILKDNGRGIYSANQYMNCLTLALQDIIANSNLFLQDSRLKLLLDKFTDEKYIFYIKDEEEQNIIGNTFEIEPNESCYDEELIDIMIKGLITNIKDNPSEEKIKYIRTKAKNNYLKYMRHINDNVGRPVLAVNSDNIIESKGEN